MTMLSNATVGKVPVDIIPKISTPKFSTRAVYGGQAES
jgi:hypothetical protein